MHVTSRFYIDCQKIKTMSKSSKITNNMTQYDVRKKVPRVLVHEFGSIT